MDVPTNYISYYYIYILLYVFFNYVSVLLLLPAGMVAATTCCSTCYLVLHRPTNPTWAWTQARLFWRVEPSALLTIVPPLMYPYRSTTLCLKESCCSPNLTCKTYLLVLCFTFCLVVPLCQAEKTQILQHFSLCCLSPIAE